jgi:DNA (cytosine-5)-methyltransferase 1
MDTKRHVCILCKSKKYAIKMVKIRSHWACLSCVNQVPAESAAAPSIMAGNGLRVLNLYAGLGGNRKLWSTGGTITAVERDIKVAAAYKELYPNDILIVGDAHKYLLKHYQEYDIIWSSPPCQSHSRMNYWTAADKKRYIDLCLYEEIILLQQFFRGKWVVENVKPYYTPLVKPTKELGRHLFWSNVTISDVDIPALPGFIELDTVADKRIIQEWLGIYYDKSIYLGSKNPIQVFRNCVHPVIGKSIFDDIIKSMKYIPLEGAGHGDIVYL